MLTLSYLALAAVLAQPAAEPVKPPADNEAQLVIELPPLPPSAKQPRVPARDTKDLDVSRAALETATRTGVERLLASQEGWERSEWPYEGVYRVRGAIPLGYRVGGTAIVAMALLDAPGVTTDVARLDALARAARFISQARTQPLMQVETYQAGYDVRGWGAIYGLHALSEMRIIQLEHEKASKAAGSNADGKTPTPKAHELFEINLAPAMNWYLDAVQRQEMPKTGGWNYARPEGVETVGAPSAFMTSSAVQALLRAKAAGMKIDQAVLDRAISVLEKTRNGLSGEVVYSGFASKRDDDGKDIPGATGRMCVVEATLQMAGKGSEAGLKRAVDAFIEHWAELDKRRVMSGTHVPPYQVAPYYFMYAHRYAAQAVEMLPEADRIERREKVNRLLFCVRSDDGTWNDRVFKRSSGFGTAFAILAMGEQPAGK